MELQILCVASQGVCYLGQCMRFFVLLAMAYAPWVNELFDNIAELVDLDVLGGFTIAAI